MNYKVSSHAPVRGHQSVLGAGRDGYSGFKSCPREGASVLSGLFRRSAHVSSHAPVRGHREGGNQGGLVVTWFQVMPP